MREFDDDVVIVGDGPAGLTAALYLAKNGMSVRVLGEDKTPLHKAMLHNQPGAPGVPGDAFVRTLREQCIERGAHLHNLRATQATRHVDHFVVRAEDGFTFRARRLVLATGRARELADALGVVTSSEGVVIDIHGRTSVDGVYAAGNLARGLTQAVISMGDGASAALDILGRERGEPFHDYDVAGAPVRPRESAWPR